MTCVWGQFSETDFVFCGCTSHSRSSHSSVRTYQNDDRHAALIHASNSIILHSDLVHMIEIVKNAYGRSWKSRKRSWTRKGEQVGLY